jgi:hypothetical protein
MFNTWRKEYPTLTYKQHQEYAAWLYENYPNQSYFGGVFQEQIKGICRQDKPARIMELGGWNGELADAVLKVETNITAWDNFEICPSVPAVCVDERYTHCAADDFVWNLDREFDYDMFVSSHALEHLTADDLRKLLHIVAHIPYLAFQLPFPPNGSWAGTTCFHILELTPAEFVDVVLSFGYKLERNEIGLEEQRFFFRKELK